MKKIKTIISVNLAKHSHFEEYFKIIDIIQSNEFSNPDICIESCKALIEGISKTIIINLDNTKTTENIDDDNLPKLFKQSMTLLSDNCEDIEGDFVLRFGGIIQVLGDIRNKRGDISHGRMAPKIIFSSHKLATTVMNMTGNILEYVLGHYFLLDFSASGKLDYEAEEMEDYNTWLDENIDFPIKKAKYSQLLFENDYDEYESRYSDEFLKADEPEEEIESKEEIITEKSENIIENLVNTFDEEKFWTESISKQLTAFTKTENLIKEEVKKIISDYLFTEKKPLRDKVVNVMNEKPSLKERAKIIDLLIEKIVSLADNLNSPKEAV